MFVRVKDRDTGHEFDLPEGHPAFEGDAVVLVKSELYPPAEAPRRPKHHIKLAGQSARRQQETSTEAPDTANEEES